MQVSEFMFKFDMIMGVSADVACSARTGTHIMQSVFHGADNVGMLPHAEIIIRAPDGDILWAVMTSKAARVGIATLVPKDINEYAIASLGMKPINRLFENSVIIHGY